jgi:hypothetical protein
MEHKYVKFENGRIVETHNENDIYLEWDGLYYIYYGKENHQYEYNGKIYDCFPIVTIDKNLGIVHSIELFGCEGDNQWDDGILFDIDFKIDDWEDCREFYDLMNTKSEYQLVGMLLHPKGNYDNHPELVAEYHDVCGNLGTLIEALKTKYVVESDNFEVFNGNAEYYFDEDRDGFYLFKFVKTINN